MFRRFAYSHSGFALLAMMIVMLGLAGMAGGRLLSERVESVNQAKFDHDRKVLLQAKEALLSYAVKYSMNGGFFYNLGRLPCTDQGISQTEGFGDLSCNGKHINASGYFPWKEMGIPILRDSNGECLWYVVSGEYKFGPPADMFNEDTEGLLSVQDENGQLYHDVDDLPIALIIAPGSVLDGQTRIPENQDQIDEMNLCEGSYDELDYLEGGVSVDYSTDHAKTVDTVWPYVFGSIGSRLKNELHNDQIIWITKDEYWDAVYKRRDLDFDDPPPGGAIIEQLTEALTECLLAFSNDANNDHKWLPWPASVDLGDYRVDAEYIDLDAPASLMGRLPLDFTNSIAAEHFSFPGNISFDSILSDDCLDPADPDLDIADMANLLTNWKDHFFYVVSSDFAIDGSIVDRFSRCVDLGACVEVETISGTPVPDNIAAIVFYASSITGLQSRLTSPDERLDLSHYLDNNGSDNNAHDYPGVDNLYYSDLGDLLYCIKFPGPGIPAFYVEKCI
jgi:hypothetical protein